MTNASSDLDESIQRVEARLVAREARVREQLRVAQNIAHAKAWPLRWVVPLVGIAALAVAWKLLPQPRAGHGRHATIRGLLRAAAHLGPALAGAAPLLARLVDRRGPQRWTRD